MPRRKPLSQTKLMVDPGFQRPLLARTFLYCGCIVLYFAIIFFFAQRMNHPNESLSMVWERCWQEAIYWIPGLMLLTPLMVIDCLTSTRRYAAPISRLRRHMKALVEEGSSGELRFRDDDHWNEMADLFNQIRGQVASKNADQCSVAEADQGSEVEADQDSEMEADQDVLTADK